MRRLYNFASRFEDYKGLTTRSSVQYCQCGYPVFVREVQSGGLWERSCYEYAEEEQPIELCPHCGVDLRSARLSTRLPKQIRDL